MSPVKTKQTKELRKQLNAVLKRYSIGAGRIEDHDQAQRRRKIIDKFLKLVEAVPAGADQPAPEPANPQAVAQSVLLMILAETVSKIALMIAAQGHSDFNRDAARQAASRADWIVRQLKS